MQPYLTLVRREIGGHFFSWTGYVIVWAVMFLLGYSFYNLLQALNTEATDQPITEVFYGTYYFWLIQLVITPVVTMRSFAQEKSSGTFETLMTTPVSDLTVVLAKFSGAVVFYTLMWLPLLLCLFLVRRYSNDTVILDAGAIAATYLGVLTLGFLYLSFGCLASAVTRSQVIAAILSFAGGISLFLLSFLATSFASNSDWKAQLFRHVGLIEHMKDFARGVVDTRPLVLSLSLTAFFLFLTFKVIESRRWK